MHLTKESKEKIIQQHGITKVNTGTPEVQVAIFTERINHLTTHLKDMKKDYSTQRSLLKLVGKRRRLLDYLKENDLESYRKIINDLNLRK
jgi:small subunit ribosomal protein S15